jgi:hypothetical protein
MNWSATAVGGGGVEIKLPSKEEALARQDEIRQLGMAFSSKDCFAAATVGCEE